MTTALTSPTPADNFNPMGLSDVALRETLSDIRREASDIIAQINKNYNAPGGSPAARDAMRQRLFPLFDRWTAIEKELDRRRI